MDDHEALAFRRLVYNFSLKLSKDECRALVYVRLYDYKERYRDADTLEVLSRLETDCVFSPNNPEGLIDVAKDINRMDLKDMVKDFVKRKGKASSKTTEKIVTRFQSEQSSVSDEQLHLKAILEVTLSQAAVFVQQVDILQQAIVAGTKEQRQKAAGAIRDAGRTAQALTKRLHEAQRELEHSDSSGSDESNDYYNFKYGKVSYLIVKIIYFVYFNKGSLHY